MNMNEKKESKAPENPPVPMYNVEDWVVSVTPWGASQCFVESASYDKQSKAWNYTLREGIKGNRFTVPAGQGIFYKVKK